MSALLAFPDPRRRGVLATPDGALHVGDAVRCQVGGDGWQHGEVVAPEIADGIRALRHGPADGSATYVWVEWEPTSEAVTSLERAS